VLQNGLTERLQRAGIERMAVTCIAGHFCIDAFKALSSVPVIDLLEVARREVQRRHPWGNRARRTTR
jgi:aspartate racemase